MSFANVQKPGRTAAECAERSTQRIDDIVYRPRAEVPPSDPSLEPPPAQHPATPGAGPGLPQAPDENLPAVQGSVEGNEGRRPPGNRKRRKKDSSRRYNAPTNMPRADDDGSSPGGPRTRLSTAMGQIVHPGELLRGVGDAMRHIATQTGRKPLSPAADASRTSFMLPLRQRTGSNVPRIGFGAPGH